MSVDKGTSYNYSYMRAYYEIPGDIVFIIRKEWRETIIQCNSGGFTRRGGDVPALYPGDNLLATDTHILKQANSINCNYFQIKYMYAYLSLNKMSKYRWDVETAGFFTILFKNEKV